MHKPAGRDRLLVACRVSVSVLARAGSNVFVRPGAGARVFMGPRRFRFGTVVFLLAKTPVVLLRPEQTVEEEDRLGARGLGGRLVAVEGQ